jgi:DNA-binding response OmpR family regulator
MPDDKTPYLTDPTGEIHFLANASTLLGRAVECEIVVVSKRASREHAAIRREGRKAILEDLNSTNGTFYNGTRIQQPIQLRDGDQISVGEVSFTFHDPDVTTRETPFPELEIDSAAGEVRVNRKLVTLSPKEFALLLHLFQKRGKVCSKDEIGQSVWAEYQTGIFDYQIENLVRRLRTKIEPDPDAPQLLITLRGLGYKLVGKPE